MTGVVVKRSPEVQISQTRSVLPVFRDTGKQGISELANCVKLALL